MVLIAVIIARCTLGRCRHIVLIFVLIVVITIPLGWTVHGDVGRG